LRRPSGPSPLELVGLGFELVVPLLVGLFGGQWLDRRFGTKWLVLVGALLGAAAGMLNLYRRVVPPKGPGPGGSS